LRVLLTGAAGFIASHVAARLLDEGDEVFGLDSFAEIVYPNEPRHRRVERLTGRPGFSLRQLDLADADALTAMMAEVKPDVVLHLGAHANLRVSIRQPLEYARANLFGTAAVLEAMRSAEVSKIVFASTSSVYGLDPNVPWREDACADRPLAPYPASKRAGELLCHSYHAMAGFDAYVLRFFNAYGPFGRPDMMPYQVTRALFERRRVTIFDGGAPKRDWTYIGDIAAGVVAAARRVSGYEILNIGRGEPVALSEFVGILEQLTEQELLRDDAPLPPTEAPITYADVSKARRLLGYEPRVPLSDGLRHFVDWYIAEHP
jgi:UDP-glucuronate 4-epimerase